MTNLVHKCWWPLLIALVLLTRLPVAGLLPADKDLWSEKNQGRSLLWYPVVGLLLALLVFLIASLLPSQLSPLISAVLIIIAWILLTGALHLDGLADSIDAAAAAHGQANTEQQRERVLKVFKDPAAGPMAVTALIVILTLKVALIFGLPVDLLPALIVSMVLSRTLVIILFLTTPYARLQGMGSALKAQLPRQPLWMVVVLSFIATFIVFPIPQTLLIFITLSLLLFFWRRFWMRKIGGFVGDCAGGLIEIAEVLVLLVLCLSA